MVPWGGSYPGSSINFTSTLNNSPVGLPEDVGALAMEKRSLQVVSSVSVALVAAKRVVVVLDERNDCWWRWDVVKSWEGENANEDGNVRARSVKVTSRAAVRKDDDMVQENVYSNSEFQHLS